MTSKLSSAAPAQGWVRFVPQLVGKEYFPPRILRLNLEEIKVHIAAVLCSVLGTLQLFCMEMDFSAVCAD